MTVRHCRVRSHLPPRGETVPSGVTVGSFDGVHLGHRAIIGDLIELCRQRSLASRVLTFYPRPAEFFAPEAAAPSLMGWREKLSILMQSGVDEIICLPFDERISQMSAQAFVEELLVGDLSARLLMIGDDFRFGSDRAGDYNLLEDLSGDLGYELYRTQTLASRGERISSSRIRQALAEGDLALATELLGQPYFVQGRVAAGQQLGRTLGAPTANIEPGRERLPLKGVFAVRVRLPDGEIADGVANLGLRPAVEERTTPLLEVHLLDFDRNLYGERLCVAFLHKIRDERNFPSKEALCEQIGEDIESARQWLAQNPTDIVDPYD